MNTVTPFPTLTPFPTPAGTPLVNMQPAVDLLGAGSFGPQVVQLWQMTVAPVWGLVSSALLILLIMSIFFIFYKRFTAEDQ